MILHSPKLQHYWNLTIRLLMLYTGHSLGESYPSTETLLVYSAAPANWAERNPCCQLIFMMMMMIYHSNRNSNRTGILQAFYYSYYYSTIFFSWLTLMIFVDLRQFQFKYFYKRWKQSLNYLPVRQFFHQMSTWYSLNYVRIKIYEKKIRGLLVGFYGISTL